MAVKALRTCPIAFSKGWAGKHTQFEMTLSAGDWQFLLVRNSSSNNRSGIYRAEGTLSSVVFASWLRPVLYFIHTLRQWVSLL
jgi:hypothetical protein